MRVIGKNIAPRACHRIALVCFSRKIKCLITNSGLISHVASRDGRVCRLAPESGSRERPVAATGTDAARLARRERVRITVRPDGSVEYDGTAQKAEIAGGHATLAEEHEQQGGQKIRRSIGGRSEER